MESGTSITISVFGITLKVSRTILSLKLVNFFTRRLETGFAGTGCCALPGMAINNIKKNKNIQPKCFNSSSFSDMVMTLALKQ